MEHVPLHLTLPQLSKLSKGKVVQLSKDQLQMKGNYTLALSMPNVRKVNRARKNMKGVRISLSPSEREQSGGAFKDIVDKIKKGAQWVSKNIIDTDLYQQKVRPMARRLVEQGVEYIPNPQARELARKGTAYLGKRTRAFGVKKIADNYSNKLGSHHPGMSPSMAHIYEGGSFRAV